MLIPAHPYWGAARLNSHLICHAWGAAKAARVLVGAAVLRHLQAQTWNRGSHSQAADSDWRQHRAAYRSCDHPVACIALVDLLRRALPQQKAPESRQSESNSSSNAIELDIGLIEIGV